MYKFKSSLIGLIGLVTLGLITTVVVPHIGRGAISNPNNAPTSQTQNVNVVNTPAVNAQQSGTWNVGINGTPTFGVNPFQNTVKIDPTDSLPVRDVDNPARQPFSFSFFSHWVGSNIDLSQSFTVPAGKRLVVEQLSVDAELVPSANQKINARVLTVTPGVCGLTPCNQNSTYYSIPGAAAFSSVSLQEFVASGQMRSYADPETTVTVRSVDQTPAEIIAMTSLSGCRGI